MVRRVSAILLLVTLAVAGGLSLRPRATRAQPVLPPPQGMVWVPPGDFLTGSDDPKADEEVGPLRRAWVDGFYIDKTEMTNEQYRKLFSDHQFPAGKKQHPVTGLTREQAQKALARLGKRLPTGLEWEKAARGTDGRAYPWGNRYDAKRAHVGPLHREDGTCRIVELTQVGSFPSGASPYGCLDMVGNAWEWIADDYPGDPVRHLIRGGAFGYPERYNNVYAFAIEQVGVT